jgi:urease accessory protein
LQLQFQRSGARTILEKSRFTLPLQVLTPLTLPDGTAYLMLLNPTGGVLGGDHLLTEIVQHAGTNVCLTTPSATRVYRTLRHPAIMDTTIQVGEGAALEYLPDHVIPHAGSALRQSLRIDLARGSRAIVLDSMASGRTACGERWDFVEMNSVMDVRICGKPALFNRTKITPAMRPYRLGLMEGLDYMACMGLFAEEFDDWQPLAAAMNAQLECAPAICGGVSLLSHGGCVIRYLARSASDMTRMNRNLWDRARELLIHLPPFDHRKY